MTTIILTIIGILLAAAAALMVIFYGGDAFNAGSVGARANTLQNGGTNVISALQLAKADGVDTSTYTAVTQLQGTGDSDYLKEFPNMASVGAGAAVLNNNVLNVPTVPAEVCARVNKNLGKIVVADVAASANFKMGCIQATATDAGTFFARG